MALNQRDYAPSGNALVDFLVAARKETSYRVWRRKLGQFGHVQADTPVRILDLGCGGGHLVRSLERWFRSASLYAGDLDDTLTHIARARALRACVFRCDAGRLPFGDWCFDAVLSLQLLEHLAQPEPVLAEVARVLKPKGLFLMSTPNPTGIAARLLRARWQGWRHDHISLNTPRKWRELLTHTGFTVLEDGSTGLSGFRVFRSSPLALVNYVPMLLAGYFPWYYGESYVAVAARR